MGNVLLAATDSNSTESIKTFTSGNQLFTAAAYKEILKAYDENVLFSPLSIALTLAIAQSGANDETGQEIRISLCLPKTKEDTETAMKSIIRTLKNDKKCSLYTANKMYVRKEFSVKRKFKQLVAKVYQGDIDRIDFTKNDKAAIVINTWVEKNTNSKIRNMIKPEELNARMTAILINALYFKGNWALPFSDSCTLREKFYKTSNDAIDVDMMHLHEKFFKYYEDKELDARFLELPFENEKMCMGFVLPNQIEGIVKLENKIDRVFVEHPVDDTLLDVGIPKFKIENTIDFKEILCNLGVKRAFDEDQADFSEIVGKQRFLCLNAVKQKTFVDVNEIGVEAAAVSVAEISMRANFGDPSIFVADHPFMFYIKYGSVILFAGKVSEPGH